MGKSLSERLPSRSGATEPARAGPDSTLDRWPAVGFLSGLGLIRRVFPVVQPSLTNRPPTSRWTE